MKEFVIGDIHGAHKALIQVLERSNFDYDNDKLIVLGDVTDGWPEVSKCFDELFKIKNLIYCVGNHDMWAIESTKGDMSQLEFQMWVQQGGEETLKSYENNTPLFINHMSRIKDIMKLYYIDEKNRLFLHAGYDPQFPINKQLNPREYYWNRSLYKKLSKGLTVNNVNQFLEIYIGHTPTIFSRHVYGYENGLPLMFGNLWNMDTGASYSGKLSLMEINSKELYQSDPVFTLYPNHKGRNGMLLMNLNPDEFNLFPEEEWIK